MEIQRSTPVLFKKQHKRRQAYSAEYKLKIVKEALALPPCSRIKPTCRRYPEIEPVQLRKWIRNLSALERAAPTAKCLATDGRTPDEKWHAFSTRVQPVPTDVVAVPL